MSDAGLLAADAEFIAESLDDRFEVLELLGRGGAGRVYRARQHELRRDVAIKIVEIADRAHELPLEVRTQSTLSWHSHILTLHEAHLIEDRFCVLVMELAANGSIQSEIAASGALQLDRVLRVGREIAEALVAAHGLGVVHCDIKPSNILVAADSTTRLADFGISRMAGATLDTFDSFRGSLRFVPPELLDGATPSEANDVYGLATTLWAAATGEQPFGGIDEPTTLIMSRLANERLDFDRFDDDSVLCAETRTVLDAAMAKDPEQRPSMPELLAALAVGTSGTPPQTSATRLPGFPRAATTTRARRALTAVGIVVALVAAAAGGAAATRRDVAKSPSTPLCTEWRHVIDAKKALFKRISVELFLTSSAVDAVRRLVIVYPNAASEFYADLQDKLQADGLLKPSERISQAQLRDLSLADAARSLNQGAPFVFDGYEGAFDERNAPPALREPARLLSNVNTVAVRACPGVKVDLHAGKRSMRDAISLRIVKDGEFIESFFADRPDSLRVLDARSLSVLLQAANDFMIGLVHNHWHWFVDLLATSEEIRTTMTYERPDLLLLALKSDPSVASQLQQPDWVADLRDSISKLDETRASGIHDLYSPQLTQLGV